MKDTFKQVPLFIDGTYKGHVYLSEWDIIVETLGKVLNIATVDDSSAHAYYITTNKGE